MQGMLRHGPFPFPVVLFYFTMEDNKAWYAWMAEPTVSSDGRYELLHHGEASCLPLDDRAIEEIVKTVDRWYDAYFARTIRETPPRSRNKISKK